MFHRRTNRIPGYDYSRPGAYFVTLCTQDRQCLFGAIVAGCVQPTPAGEAVVAVWSDLTKHYAHVELDAFILMPDHFHGIVFLSAVPDSEGRHGLPEIMRALKSYSARRINDQRGTPGAPVWQRSYHERVIRNDSELQAIREYIAENPARWAARHVADKGTV